MTIETETLPAFKIKLFEDKKDYYVLKKKGQTIYDLIDFILDTEKDNSLVNFDVVSIDCDEVVDLHTITIFVRNSAIKTVGEASIKKINLNILQEVDI